MRTALVADVLINWHALLSDALNDRNQVNSNMREAGYQE
jgi:hypothetical protein